jgi:hypothetical protein
MELRTKTAVNSHSFPAHPSAACSPQPLAVGRQLSAVSSQFSAELARLEMKGPAEGNFLGRALFSLTVFSLTNSKAWTASLHNYFF